MLTLAQMRGQVASRITIDDSDYDTKIDEWLNYRYDDIIGRKDWPQLYRTSTVTVSEGDSTIILPRDCDLLINIQDRTNNINLTPLNPSAGGRAYADVIDSNGQTTVYWWEGVTVLKQPSATTTIYAVSSSASDTTQTVRVTGTDSDGAEISQSVTLTGITAVAFTTDMARIDRVSKDANTVGLVQITDLLAANTFAKIDPYSYGTTYNQIRIVQPSSAALTFNITYKIKVPRLVNNEDIPIIDCSQALVLGAYISALRQQRQHSKAKLLEYNQIEPYDPTTYEGKVRSMIQEIDQQANNIPVMRPMIERNSIDTPLN